MTSLKQASGHFYRKKKFQTWIYKNIVLLSHNFYLVTVHGKCVG